MPVKIYVFLLCLILPLTGGAAETIETDICVYGATGGGIAAAIQAVRLGKTVALVEPTAHIGGINIEGLGGSDINNHNFINDIVVGGLARDFYLRLGKKYGKDGPAYKFEPHVAEEVFNEWVAEHKIKLFLNHRISEEKSSVEKSGAKIVSARMENGAVFRAKVFIDATIEGDLLAFAGVKTYIGREANSLYGETKNGIRAENTYRQFEVKVDPYIVPGDPKSGVIPTIQNEPLGTPGEGDHRLQGYCFRMCLTAREDNRIPFSKPANFDRAQYEIYLRYIKAGGKLWTPGARLPNGKTDQGSWHDLSANLYGMNFDYPGGNYATRKKVFDQHLTFTQGLCWFLANDPEIPEALRKEWSRWGVCKDEFKDHGGWPRQFYVRDARRMVSDYVITEHHTRRMNPTPVEDSVGVAYWPPDTHHVRRIIKDGYAYNEGFVFGGDDWGPFGISYRALTPKISECENLLTPTCPSSSHVAYGAIRLEWTFMILGQSCASAAAMAIDDNVPVQKVSYDKLRVKLLGDGQVLDAPAFKAK